MTKNEQQNFIQHLALALVVHEDSSPREATLLAERFYTQAWDDYSGPGGSVYGPSHAGLMQWMLERLSTHQSAVETP
jgi:hypothetical protein